LIDYFSLNYADLKKKLANSKNNLIIQGLAEIDELYMYLEGTDAVERMRFAPYLARGIDVYTGMVWEVFLKDRQIAGKDFNVSIGGGGRYDNIITTFIDDGTEYPAVGMSFGLDVIYEILALKDSKEKTSVVDIFVIPLGTEKKSFEFASKLRNAGLKVEIDKNVKKLKKSMTYANKMNIPFVIILGEDEITKGSVQLKNMKTGGNTKFYIDNVMEIKNFVLQESSAQ